MNTEFVSPEFAKNAFHCPFCGAYAHMEWERLSTPLKNSDVMQAICAYCGKYSVWLITEMEKDFSVTSEPLAGEMIHPVGGFAEPPVKDMPNDVQKDYREASIIFTKSPRGAAALLRLALQKLCKHLGQPGENINSDIRKLAKENKIPPQVVKVADTVRITGNNAVHPGEMSEEDFDQVSSKLFDLLNFIVKKAITEPAEIEALYSTTPEGPRRVAEQNDAKSRQS